MDSRWFRWVFVLLLAVQGQMSLAQEEFVDKVYPYLDAANSRWFYFSSACRPFGMVNLSPDMAIDGAWNSGYRYHEDSIKYFSHIHAWQLSGVPMMPVVGEMRGHLGPDVYGSRYSHDREKVFPGYHQVDLLDYGIGVELTSTPRVGFHRYTFPKSKQSAILLDLATVVGPSGTDKGRVQQVGPNQFEGYALMAATIRRPKPTYVFFSIEINHPVQGMLAWQEGKILGKVDSFEGENGGVAFQLKKTKANKPVLMKVGISYVSAEKARLNREEELPHWDFDAVVEASREEWNEKLGRIVVEGNSEQQQRRFYTDLWKALQGRRMISDVDGSYCDMTGERRIGQIPLDANGKPKYNHYNSDSFWGAQWTITTLWQLVYPEIAEEFIQSMLMMYQDGGLIPRGPSGGNYTYVMTGASSTPFIIGAYMKGIRGFDVNLMYEGLKKNASPEGMMAKAGYEHNTWNGGGIKEYIELGYVPYPISDKRWGGHQDGAGQTLEYAFQDWCLAQLALRLNKMDDYQYFMQRSNNWKNIFNTTIGWIHPRNAKGQWLPNYDEYEHQHGFVESNGAQATWYVPHDLAGLAFKMGGNSIAADKLTASFQAAEKLDFTAGKSHSAELNAINRRIPINYGNQPSIQTAFVYNYLQHPWLTQYWSRKVLEKAFSGLSPTSGYNGDEDQGLMGSLAVLMKIGLFEMHAGCAQRPFYDIGSPIFDRITIHLNPKYYEGEKFEIVAKDNGPEKVYIQSATLNSKIYHSAYIFHDQLVKGGKIELQMSDQPNKMWGVHKTMSPSDLLAN